MSLRGRLAIGASLLIAVTLAGLGAYLGRSLEGWSAEALDGELHRQADELEGRLELEHGELELEGDTEASFAVYDEAGQVLLSSRPAPPRAPAPGHHAISDANGRAWRSYSRALASHEGLSLSVAAPADRYAGVARRFRGGLLGAVVLGALLGGIGALLLAERLTAPLRALSTAVAEIDAGSLGRRVPEDPRDAEVLALARAVNGTLSRLEAAFARESGLVARASHALRTPLAAVLSSAEVALRRQRSADELREALEEIAEVARGAALLSEGLLRLSRAEGAAELASREELRLSPLVETLRALFAARASERDLTLEVEVAPTVVLRADRARLLELLEALLDNAVRYAPRGGRVGLRAVEEPGSVLIEVWDDGPGIPEDERARVFERFQRGRAAAESGEPGTGLGLSIARAVAEAHGATLELLPREGGGTRAVLRWPHGAAPRSPLVREPRSRTVPPP